MVEFSAQELSEIANICMRFGLLDYEDIKTINDLSISISLGNIITKSEFERLSRTLNKLNNTNSLKIIREKFPAELIERIGSISVSIADEEPFNSFNGESVADVIDNTEIKIAYVDFDSSNFFYTRTYPNYIQININKNHIFYDQLIQLEGTDMYTLVISMLSSWAKSEKYILQDEKKVIDDFKELWGRELRSNIVKKGF